MGASRKIRKDMFGCYQAAVGKNKYQVQFSDGKLKYMSTVAHNCLR